MDSDQLRNCYREFYSSENGETILKDLREMWYDVIPYQPQADMNVNDTIFYEGARTVVAYILSYLTEDSGAPAPAPSWEHRGGQYL